MVKEYFSSEEHTSDTLEAIRRADKDKETVKNFAIEQATDPLNYIGAGSVGVGGKALRGLFGGMLAAKASNSEAALWGKIPKEIMNAVAFLKKSGASDLDIFKKTGVYQNPRGEYRLYSTDKGSFARPSGLNSVEMFKPPTELGNIVDNPRLFSKDPELAKLGVRHTGLESLNGTLGWFNKENNQLAVKAYGTKPSDLEDARKGTSKWSQRNEAEFNKHLDKVYETLMHEVQHAIQAKEGMVGGGNVSQFLPKTFNKAKDKLYTSEQTFLKTLKDQTGLDISGWKVKEYLATQKKIKNGQEPWDFEAKKYKEFQESMPRETLGRVEKYFTKLTDIQSRIQASEAAAFKKYQSIPGEVEARFTADNLQRDLQTEGVFPSDLYDIPDRDFYLGYKDPFEPTIK